MDENTFTVPKPRTEDDMVDAIFAHADAARGERRLHPYTLVRELRAMLARRESK